MYKCPNNHDSEAADFCSVCGAELVAAPAVAAPPGFPATPPALTGESAGSPCPDCGTSSESPTQVFCEVCGRNFRTGSSGIPPARAPSALAAPARVPPAIASAAGPTRWSVTVQVDASHYGTSNPDAPVAQPPQVFSLFQDESLIGRNVPGVRTQVPVHNDPGVSRRHAVLLRNADGGLAVRDLGSANGTQLNGVELVPGVSSALKDGDCIALGAWTKIVIKKP